MYLLLIVWPNVLMDCSKVIKWLWSFFNIKKTFCLFASLFSGGAEAIEAEHFRTKCFCKPPLESHSLPDPSEAKVFCHSPTKSIYHKYVLKNHLAFQCILYMGTDERREKGWIVWIITGQASLCRSINYREFWPLSCETIRKDAFK